jgi:dihydroxyacetone kinase
MTAELTRIVLSAMTALEAGCDELCRLDSVAGDGDHGFAMARAAKGVQTKLAASQPPDPAALTKLVANEFASVGGAMGALGYVLVQALATSAALEEPFSASTLARLLTTGEDAVTEFGGARPGDKTMVDAIDAARAQAEECAKAGVPPAQALLAAAAGAQDGAERTAALIPRAGRASRLGEQSLGYVDPGAQTVAIVLTAMAEAYAASASAA